MIAELVKSNRSCRRFYEDHHVELKTLEETCRSGAAIGFRCQSPAFKIHPGVPA